MDVNCNLFFLEMKNFNKILIVFSVLFCSNSFAQSNKTVTTYGTTFDAIEEVSENWKILDGLKEGSPITTQLSGKIIEVCQAKGCWMNVVLDNGSEVFVKFKDYGFFVPKDAAGDTVVMQGEVTLEELSVEAQKHYAKDKGASEGELELILRPKKTLKFIADGVAITTEP